MIDLITDLIFQALDEEINKNEIEISLPKSAEFGDYSSNIAMKLANKLKDTPMNIASNIKEKINHNQIEKIEIKAPGFINFYVKKNYLFENLNKVLEDKEKYGSSNIGNNKKVNIEFVSANPTGILHLGNARGGAYGDSLAKVMRFAGFNVTSEYYINDAGNQINNLGLSVEARYRELCNLDYNIPENGYFGNEIIDIAKEIYAKNPNNDMDLEYFKEYATKYLLDKIFANLSDFRINYDVKTSEKEIYKKYPLKNIVNELTNKGYTYEAEDAIWFKSSNLLDDKDHVLLKNDGTFTYLVPDIAYHLDKYNRGFDKMFTVLGTDHHGYVNRLKSALKAMDKDESKLDIKLLQLVRVVKDNEVVKMSKRTGKSITLDDLMSEVGVNATRYYFVCKSLDTQMDFNIDLAVKKSNENPIYYISYAYARICSILNNYKEIYNIENYSKLDNEYAYNVLNSIYKFKNVVESAANKALPHLIANYVYELASNFHVYYSNIKIITEDEEVQKENLNLINAVKITLENALNLIGIIPPEKM